MLAIADGAGGTTRGREAARATTTLIAHECTHASLDDEERIAHVLRSIDVRLTRERGGQTTVGQAAVALVTAARLPTGKMQDDLAMFVVRPR